MTDTHVEIDQSWLYPQYVSTYTPVWTLQRCVICDGKGYVHSGLPTLTPDKCTFCDGKKAVLVSAYGTVQRITNF